MTSTNTSDSQSTGTKAKPSVKLDHIGWITRDVTRFERFWCKILGFIRINESFLTPEMGQLLFDAGPALIRSYSHPQWDINIEIHEFIRHATGNYNYAYKFDRCGINHICIHTGGSGSRNEFMKTLPADIRRQIYDNPRGWQNIFVQDYEGNFIELRENLE